MGMGKRTILAALAAGLVWAGMISYWTAPLTRYPMDSYYYILLGDSLARGDGYALLGKPHDHFAPGYPFHIAALEKIGAPAEGGARFLSVLFGAATLALMILLAARWFGALEAAIAALLLATNFMFGRWCMAPMSEPLFAFYCLAAIGLAARAGGAAAAEGAISRRKGALFAAFLIGGAAVLVRFTGVLLLPVLWVLVLGGWRWQERSAAAASGRNLEQDAQATGNLGRDVQATGGLSTGARQQFWLVGAATLFFLAPLALWLVRNRLALGAATAMDYLHSDLPRWQLTLGFFMEQLNFCFLKFPLADLATPTVPAWFRWVRVALIVTYWGGVAWGTAVGWRRRRLDVLALALWVALLHLFHVAWPFREERFLMPALPAVAMLTAFGIGTWARRRAKNAGTQSETEGEAELEADARSAAERVGIEAAKSEFFAPGHSPVRPLGPLAPRMRLALLGTGLWAMLLLGFCPIVYRMQEIGLKRQSTAALAEIAGLKIRPLLQPNDRVATSLNPAETLYYLRHGVEPVRNMQELRKLVESFLEQAKTPAAAPPTPPTPAATISPAPPPSLWILVSDSWTDSETGNLWEEAQKRGFDLQMARWNTKSHGSLYSARLSPPAKN